MPEGNGRFIITFLLLCAALLSLSSGMILLTGGFPRHYTGVELITADTEYLDFMKGLTAPDVYVQSLDVVAASESGLPVLVDFKVVTYNSYEFPYGERDYDNYLIAILGAIVFSALSTAVIQLFR